jgi:hypothetical protein
LSGKQYVLTVLGGGKGFTLADTDLWGLLTALNHGLDDGYFKDNLQWAEGMIERLNTLRGGSDDRN